METNHLFDRDAGVILMGLEVKQALCTFSGQIQIL